MTKKCFVPECKSGYKTCKEKVSLFKVPSNEGLLQKWQSAIAREDRPISRKDHVCEKHFQEDDIIRFWIYKDIKDKLKIPRLKKNAVPSIFPNKCTSVENTAVPNKTRKKKNKTTQLDSNLPLFDNVENFATLNILKEPDLFNKLWNSELVVTFPSPSWAFHKVENCASKTIVISDVMISNNIPCYQKQIIMNDDSTVSIIIGTSIISQQEQIKYFGNPVGLDNLEDLSILINTLHLLNLTLDGITSESGFCEILN